MVLKKEVMKTQNRELDKGPEYRQLLVQVSCAVCRWSVCQISQMWLMPLQAMLLDLAVVGQVHLHCHAFQ